LDNERAEPESAQPPDSSDATTDQLLSVYLAKYGSLREELFQRFQFQGQAFNFLIVVLTALLAVGAGQLAEGRGDILDRLVLFIPLVTGPFGFLYLAHDLMIFSIAASIQSDLSRDVSQLLGREIALGDARFTHLSVSGRLAHRALAPSRWLLFVLPTVLPVLYAALFTRIWRAPPFSLLFVLDGLIVVILLLTMAAAAREEAGWRRRHGAAPAGAADRPHPR
jgi:hypothetical protein